MDEIIDNLERKFVTTMRVCSRLQSGIERSIQNSKQKRGVYKENKQLKNDLSNIEGRYKNVKGMNDSTLKEKALKNLWHDTMSQECFDNKPFVFNGNESDMCFFYAKDVMPYSLIDEQSESIKNAERTVMSKCEQRGLVKSTEKGFEITEEGITYISSKNFMESAKFQQANVWNNKTTSDMEVSAVEEKTNTFAFDGTEADLKAFKGADTINLEDVYAQALAQASSPNEFHEVEEQIKQMQTNYTMWNDNGIVEIDNDWNVKLTDVGEEFVNSDVYKNLVSNANKEFKTETLMVGGSENESSQSYITDNNSFTHTSKCKNKNFHMSKEIPEDVEPNLNRQNGSYSIKRYKCTSKYNKSLETNPLKAKVSSNLGTKKYISKCQNLINGLKKGSSLKLAK